MRHLIFTLVFCVSCTTLFAQEPIEVIEFKNLLGGTNFVYAQDGKGLTKKDLLDIMKVDKEAYQQMKIAKRKYTLSQLAILSSVGIMMATELSSNYFEIGKIKTQIGFKIVAMGLSVSYLPLLLSSKKQKRNAVRIYNEGLESTKTGMNKFRPQLGLADNGLGLKVSF